MIKLIYEVEILQIRDRLEIKILRKVLQIYMIVNYKIRNMSYKYKSNYRYSNGSDSNQDRILI